ncbi:acetyl-CoA carboxylase biotin carboxyl carrier protein [Oscillatoria acuminata]|uniref:Biotin carboxyl carrier protein of acetyl-CoA carboxylase n=1 Tax=Oscillatoria acuminata PCC 6304 TaxID=56110 RepID=K9TD64_9CYAN|nr:acetyl-CoA carboxylase biotin carboxyl carrier protein [Oscillatoria acuminata]AFY80348.1 biotin carboxyl carrier protein [Oscillatoria acuminata PCC 6304]
MQLDLSQLSELLGAFNGTDISELILKSGDFELTLRKDRMIAERVGIPVEPGLILTTEGTGAIAPPRPPIEQATPTPPPSGTPGPTGGNGLGGPSGSSPAPVTNDRKFLEVISPMVGTFYRSPSPDEAPFVAIGDRIKIGQTVCIIEAMKLMNEIEAEVSGQVVEILVENGTPVEYGQPLMRISPE